jgi:hypothetical protein
MDPSYSAHLPMHSTYLSSSTSQEWIANSRATKHMTKHQHLLYDYQHQHSGKKVIIGDNSTLPLSGCDDVLIDTTKFGEVLHVA